MEGFFFFRTLKHQHPNKCSLSSVKYVETLQLIVNSLSIVDMLLGDCFGDWDFDYALDQQLLSSIYILQ